MADPESQSIRQYDSMSHNDIEDGQIHRSSCRSTCWHALKLMPWTVVFLTFINIGGLATWVIYMLSARDKLKAAMTEVGVQRSMVDCATSWYNLVITVVGAVGLAVMLMILLTEVFRELQKAAAVGSCEMFGEPGKCSYRSYMCCGGFFNFILWWAILFSAAIVMAMGLMFTNTYIVSRLAKQAASIADGLTSSNINALQVLSDNVQIISTSLGQAPTNVKNATWYTDATAAAAAIQGSMDSGSVCAPSCLDLTDFKAMLTLDTYCICGGERLQGLYTNSKAAWDNIWPAGIGSVVMFITSTWLLIKLTSDLVHARRDFHMYYDAYNNDMVTAAINTAYDLNNDKAAYHLSGPSDSQFIRSDQSDMMHARRSSAEHHNI